MRSFLATIAFCSLAAIAVSCDDSEESRPAECTEIVEACHAADPGSGPIHACHESAEEEWTKDQCVSNRTSCLTMCAAARDGGGQ
jgi:hypothetical protein